MFKKSICFMLVFCTVLGLFGCSGAKTPDTNGPDTSDPNGEKPNDDTTPPEVKVKLNATEAMLICGIDAASSASFSATVTKDGTPDAAATVEWSVSDKAIAEVDQSGKVTAKAAGNVKLTAKCGDASADADIVVLATASADDINSFSESCINTYGRTYIKNGALHIDHTASAFEVAIYGTSLSANVKATATMYLSVFVDGAEESTRVKIEGTKAQDITIAEGLDEGYHVIRVVKATEMLDSFLTVNSLSADNFVSIPENDGIKIEFIGDSISCGYGTLQNANNGWSVDNSDAAQSYAYYAAQILKANYSIIAMRGTCVKEHLFGVPSMMEMYPNISTNNSDAYKFKFKPDIVVINLGTNDGGYIDAHPDYADRFPEDYYNLLSYVRMKNPSAHIVCLYGMMGINEHVDAGIKAAIEQMNDDKISYVSSFKSNFDSAGGHPSASAAEHNAKLVAAHIKSILK